MRIRSSKNNDDSAPPEDGVLSYTKTTYRKFSDYVAFRDDDPIWMLIYKLFLRLVGIVFALILSPFVLIGLVLAFIGAS